ncbi:MAG TPA: UTP--glucose-1-phosphate uridylyltransferase, partial [Verrucomicrobiales bacterium]|nr:UTP--glucose-1-phosphate uridylyltransferase [Verrucomicrobiales bacterium]
LEGSGQKLSDVLARLVGPGLGLEIVSNVRGIPKGSRLAVSTNLLGCLISVCMRATGQAAAMSGPLGEEERRVVAARAILGEWLGGSGGGWQDSGGVWPGMKLIEGVPAMEGDPEFGVSRGRLLPRHHVFSNDEISSETRRRLQDSLVLVHGGMAQNVGPILEMVTEKYLLRSEREWQARTTALGLLDQVTDALKAGDVRRLGELTTQNFKGPIQSIIPWATNDFTETLIRRVGGEFGDDFWGFWMLGGMSGGGMGFIFAPGRKAAGQERLLMLMNEVREELQHALPFAMAPVVYDFAINEQGTVADFLPDGGELLPPAYYTLMVPRLLRLERRSLSPLRRMELDRFGAACRSRAELGGVVQDLFDALLPRGPAVAGGEPGSLRQLLEANGFDRQQHEQIRADLRNGRIGLAQNRLSGTTVIEDVSDDDVTFFTGTVRDDANAATTQPDWAAARAQGEQMLRDGRIAVVTLAAGAGTRWTQGAGVAKALHPFCRFAGRHRTFIETHLAKSRRRGREFGRPIPHVFTTSHLTHEAIGSYLARRNNHGYQGPLLLSSGRSIGLRMIPTVRDLRFQWEEISQQVLDEQQQKVRESLRAALIEWAQKTGEAADYTDNVPTQCLHPVGHWYEVPNLLRNGTLRRLLDAQPRLEHLLLHNIDTLGADVDPALLGWFAGTGAALAYEVIPRRVEDRGGGLARVNGGVRLVEGLALPDEEDEFRLRFYNSMTTWINIDRFLGVMELDRASLADDGKVQQAVRELAGRMPTYVTLKEVKRRWGHGQEDVFPVAQFEKLWGDMTALGSAGCRFVVVPRRRGQQLKDQAQLDGWLRDGSAAHVDGLCAWE